MPRLKHNDPIRAISQHITPVDQSDKVQSRTQRATRTVDSEYRGVQIPQPQPQTTSSALQQQLQRMQEALANVTEELERVQRTTAAQTRSPRSMDDARAAALPPSSRTIHASGTRATRPRLEDDTATAAMSTRRQVQRPTRPPAQKTVDTAAAMSTRHPGQRTATRHPGQRTPALYKPLRTSDKYQIVDPQVIVADGNIFNKFSLDKPDIKFMRVIEDDEDDEDDEL